jgi:hypothetical protein
MCLLGCLPTKVKDDIPFLSHLHPRACAVKLCVIGLDAERLLGYKVAEVNKTLAVVNRNDFPTLKADILMVARKTGKKVGLWGDEK